jgi:trk system potassium uptake protein TrkH
MFLAGTNLAIIYFAIKGNFRKIVRNNEFVLYTILAAGFSIIIAILLTYIPGVTVSGALSDGFFNAISILSTTGFYTSNFSQWGNLAVLIIFILMFPGGMAGSASGGIKIIRLMIVTKNARNESKRLIHPHAYLPVRIDKKRVPQNIVYNLLIFIILYFFTLCAGTLLISFLDYDVITSFSTTASMLGNIGPGLGTFGPFTTYSAMPSTGKWLLCGLMLLGRLELLTVIVLFTRSFYKK